MKGISQISSNIVYISKDENKNGQREERDIYSVI